MKIWFLYRILNTDLMSWMMRHSGSWRNKHLLCTSPRAPLSSPPPLPSITGVEVLNTESTKPLSSTKSGLPKMGDTMVDTPRRGVWMAESVDCEIPEVLRVVGLCGVPDPYLPRALPDTLCRSPFPWELTFNNPAWFLCMTLVLFQEKLVESTFVNCSMWQKAAKQSSKTTSPETGRGEAKGTGRTLKVCSVTDMRLLEVQCSTSTNCPVNKSSMMDSLRCLCNNHSKSDRRWIDSA